MASKLSAKAQQALDALLEAKRKVDRIHGLVEQYATAKKGGDHFAGMISRAAKDVGRVFLNSGQGVMADHANQMAMLARRGGATQTKFRGLREMVGALQGEIERAEKKIVADDEAEHADDG